MRDVAGDGVRDILKDEAFDLFDLGEIGVRVDAQQCAGRAILCATISRCPFAGRVETRTHAQVALDRKPIITGSFLFLVLAQRHRNRVVRALRGAIAATDASQRIDQIEPKPKSPYEPVEFDFSVNNSSKWPEVTYLEPEGLPYGMRLTIYPKRRTISAGETAIFRCTLELDDKVIDASCRGDHDFRITAWRVEGETAVRWGGVQYKVRPRKRTATDFSGYWDHTEVEIKGHVTPHPGGGLVRIRLAYADQHARWVSAELQPGGTFVYKEKPPANTFSLLAVALFEGNKYWSESRSPERKILPPPVIR
jgi:hypothetical protein